MEQWYAKVHRWGLGYRHVMEFEVDRHNWFDDTINNIDCEVCAVRGGLIDGVNILPKIGNDDAYQKSREMIYTPYTMFTVSYILHRTFPHILSILLSR